MAPTPHPAEVTLPPPVCSRQEALHIDTSAVPGDDDVRKSLQAEPLTATPDTPELSQTQKETQSFRKAFDDNMRNKPVKHEHGHVLLISWEDQYDDLQVKDEVTKLKGLFENQYGFSVEWEKLLNNKRHQLKSILSKFMDDYDKEDTLLIIYYAGHGISSSEGISLQAAASQQTVQEKKRNRIAWSAAAENLTGSEADILVIFDCCDAGGVGGFKVRSPRPNFEYIAACRNKERARGPGKHSFTSGLMWALEELHDQSPFTSISLVEKIKSYKHLAKDQTPELRRQDEYADGLVWIAPIHLKGPEPDPALQGVKRNPHHEYIDLRFNFYRQVEINDAIQLAKQLSHLVNHKDNFEAKHITLLDKSSTFSKAVAAWRSPGSINGKRKISSSSTYVRKDQPDHSEITSPPVKRQRVPSTRLEQSSTSQALTQNMNDQGAFYHFRMFLNCSLQTVGSNIAHVADRVRPPLPQRAIEDTRKKD